MIVLGIDPGLKGGIALLNGTSFETWPMPVVRFKYTKRSKTIQHVDVVTLHWLARMSHVEAIVVEQATIMPRQSAQSAMTSGANYGLLLSLRLVAPTHVVHPATWKAALKVPADKKRATSRCRELFQGQPTPEKDGPAEALMLALYWQQKAGTDGDTERIRVLAGAAGRPKAIRGGLRPGTGNL